MEDFYTRTALLLGEEKTERIRHSSVLIAGLGGVGAYIAEALARCGIGHLGLCDFDTVDASNKNRQLLALDSTLGMRKTAVCAGRIKDINSACIVDIYDFRIDESNVDELLSNEWDYAADAVDDVKAKVLIVKKTIEKGIPVVSCCGTGNRLDPRRFEIADISKTHDDPLARVLRRGLRDEGIEKGVDVLFSDEPPVVHVNGIVPSVSFVPSAAGLIIAGEIIGKL